MYFCTSISYKYILINRYIHILFTRFSDLQFFQRFRFPKYIVLTTILPMVYSEDIFPHFDKRGLRIDQISKILIALRFYASGSDQV